MRLAKLLIGLLIVVTCCTGCNFSDSPSDQKPEPEPSGQIVKEVASAHLDAMDTWRKVTDVRVIKREKKCR